MNEEKNKGVIKYVNEWKRVGRDYSLLLRNDLGCNEYSG